MNRNHNAVGASERQAHAHFLQGVPVLAFRISYVGEQGWELHFKYEDGLALWDALHALGVTPVGVETYANSRRMEKSLRLQNADLLTEYNPFECELARPKVKATDFHGKEAHLKFREREHQPATLCTLVMTSNIDSTGVARYPLGNCPVMDPATGAALVDALGRRSYTTSIAFGPSIAARTLPWTTCRMRMPKWGGNCRCQGRRVGSAAAAPLQDASALTQPE